MPALVPAEAALARVLEGIGTPDEEVVPITLAVGRVLTGDLTAKLTQPPFNASAMDGYAIHGGNAAALGDRWTVVGEAAAGGAFQGTVGTGEAVRIFTGAPVPDTCGTVIIQEDVTREGAVIQATRATSAGANIRSAGNDFAKGDTLLRRGRRLDAHSATLAAAMGYGDAPVARRPVVALIATGDELVPPGTLPGPDEIVSSNPVGLAALIAGTGATPRDLGIAPDDKDALAARIAEANTADVLITIGGASVGDRDLVGPVLKEQGVDLDFWKVAIRPGKPLMFGCLGKTRVLGLPGNPVSALVTARVFLVPLLRALQGETLTDTVPERAILTASLEANGPRLHLMRGKLARNGDGALTVTAMPSQDSSLLSALAASDCLIRRQPDASALPAGAPVEIERL